MTVLELKRKLLAGYTLCDCFDFTNGQECEIYKTGEFHTGNEIIYIPDVDLNELRWHINHSVQTDSEEETDSEVMDIIACCYTGNDFIELCNGDIRCANRLFEYVDWQHPSYAVDEVVEDINEETFSPGQIVDLWLEFGDVPMNPDTECIEEQWNGFPTGTHREEIWEWFDDVSECGVYKLMYDIENIQRRLNK